MNDTDISPGRRPEQEDDATEKSLPDLSPSSNKTEADSTDMSLTDDQTEKSVFASQSPPASGGAVRDQAASSPADEPTEKSFSSEAEVPVHRATIPQKGGSSTDLMDKPGDTNYAALLSPEGETFIPEAGVSPSAPAHPLPGYPSVPGYEILGALGRGGMGVVYKARHEGLRRLVALKMILHGNLASAGDLARFHIEAESIARLQHPNIVQIYEIGTYNGLPFFSLEFVDGGSLASKVNGMPQPNDEAAQIVETLAKTMAFAHQRGIVHRDLKPANILLQSGGAVSGGVVSGEDAATHRSPITTHHSPLTTYQPKIVDFGLAKKLDELSGQTHSGAVMGTPSYMSPEQADGRIKEIGPAADVYALGAILYEMLTGRPPFRAEKPMDTIRMVIQDEPVPPVRLNPGVARDLETICLKCLQKDSAKRYVTAQDLAEDLRRFLEGAPISARPVTRTERALKWVKRRPALAAVYGLLTMVTLLGSLGGILAWRWYETDTAKRAIEEALQREQLALQREAQANEKLEQHFYIHRINLAWRDWDAGDVLHARKAVEGCAVKRRQWEWHYLHRQVFPELLTLTDMGDEPLQVLFAPRGDSLLVVDKDNRVRARDAATGTELPAPFEGTPVQYVAYGPGGKLIAAAGTDRAVVLREVTTGRTLHTLRGHQGAVVHLAFSPDGTRLATASWDKTAKIWDVVSGKDLFTLKGHGAEVAWLAFRSDGRQLATASWDTTVRIWDPAAGKEFAAPRMEHADAVTQVVYSPDGKRLATACFDKTVKLWDAGTYMELPPLLGPMEDINQVAFSPDGGRIALAKRDKTLKIFDVYSGKQLFFLQGHFEEVTQVAYSPEGERIVSTGKDKTVKVWDATAAKDTLILQGTTDNNCLAYSPNGRPRAAVCLDKTVQLWDTHTGKVLAACVGHSEEVGHLAYHPTGSRLASASKDKTVKIWSADTGKELRTLTGHAAEVTHVAFNADGTRLVSGSADRLVKVWDVDTGKELFSLAGLTGAIRHLAFHPDGRQLAACAEGSSVHIWDTRSGKVLFMLPRSSDDVFYLAYSADGTQLATAGKDHGVKLWDASSGRELYSLSGPTGDVMHLAFSPDGHVLATAGWDKTIKLWNASQDSGKVSSEWSVVSGGDTTHHSPLTTHHSPKAGTLLFTLEGHVGAVACVAFSPNSQRLASASWDRTVKLWDVQTGKELLSLPRHTEAVTSVTFSPDGSQLASTSREAVKIWEGKGP